LRDVRRAMANLSVDVRLFSAIVKKVKVVMAAYFAKSFGHKCGYSGTTEFTTFRNFFLIVLASRVSAESFA
jgi:hypothetical protein